MFGALIFCLVLFTLFVAMGYMVKSAPEGYEDRSGFHFGKPPRILDWPIRNAIGQNLRHLYSAILHQPMPQQFYAYTRRLAVRLSEGRGGPKHIGALERSRHSN